MLPLLRGQQTAARGRRSATCPPSRPGPATSNHPLPFPRQQQGDATVFTEQKRKEAEPSTSSNTPTRPSEPRTAQTSPLVYARVAGFLYLALAVLGAFGLVYVPSMIIVAGDAAATANNIGASEPLCRLGRKS